MQDFINWDEIPTTKIKGITKTICPKCSHDRKKKKDPCLYVNLDSGVAKCFNCETLGFKDSQQTTQDKPYDLPKQDWRNYTALSDNIVKWFKDVRGISQSTLINCGITEEKYYQPAIAKEVSNIVFNYFERETLVNKKYRSGGKHFTQSKGTKNIFYGINDIIGCENVYIVEGELDKLAMYEAGFKNCISVPNGANDNDDVWENSKQYLTDVKKFYIATDMDEKGQALSEKIAQRLGRYRCARIEFNGKDANDDLLSGLEVLKTSLNNFTKYPVTGTFTVKDLKQGIYDLYDNGLPETIKPTGEWFSELNNIFSVMRGHLVTGTGIPSHGKSNFTDWYVMNLCNDYDMKASWFSPEHNPMRLHHSNFIQKYFGQPFFSSSNGVPRITREQIDVYEQWANEKIYLTAPDQNEKPTWSWLLDKFKEQMFNYGIDIFVIDAFNKVLFNENGNRYEQINTVLTELTTFAQMHNVIIFLVAHPTKGKKQDNGIYPAPTLYDVAGSADFRNQTHDGFCIYRHFDAENPENDQTEFVNLKTKYSFQGTIGQSARFTYDMPSSRYFPLGKSYPPFALADGLPTLDTTQEVKEVFSFKTPQEAFDNDEIPF